MRSFLEWCGLSLLLLAVFCARGNWPEPSSVRPVAFCARGNWPEPSSVRPVVHKACLYASLAVTPSRPTPTCPHCQQELGLARFRRLCWQLSGKWSSWFECPLAPAPPHAHSYHGVYLQIMDPPPPPPPSSAGPPYDDDSVSGTHRLNSPAPLAPPFPASLAHLGSFFLCSFHLGASTTTTTTTTIVTTPRRQAIAGKKHFFRARHGTWAVM